MVASACPKCESKEATKSGVVGGVLLLLAFISANTLPETYGKDLDYVEEE